MTLNHLTKLSKCSQIKKLNFTHLHQKCSKPKNVILKGVKGDFNEDYILSELKEQAVPQVEIKKITKVSFNKNKPGSYSFLIQLSPNSDTHSLYKIKYLAHQKIKWEPLRKNKVFQCRNCQRVGYTSVNCHLGYRCVKCSKQHKYGECDIKELTDKEKIYCVNCEKYGHPASYRGCPFLKFVQNYNNQYKLKRQEIQTKKLNKISNYVNKNKSYAQATNFNNINTELPNTFDPLQNYVNSTQSQNNEFSSNLTYFIENLKKEILLILTSQLAHFEEKINENTSKINLIYNSLFEKY